MATETLYANTAALGQLTESAAKEIANWSAAMHRPDFYGGSYRSLSMEVETCRKRAALLLQESSNGNGRISIDDIALVSNTSEGIAIAAEAGAHSLSGQKRVVISRGSFISTRVHCLALLSAGCEVIEAGDATGFLDVRHLREIDNIGMLVIDHVNYVTGVRSDLNEISKFCRQNNIILIVDAVQSLGACTLDCDLTVVDAVACGGHKWLRGPEGTGFLYLNQRLSEARPLRRLGYKSLDRPGDFDQAVSMDSLCRKARGVEIGTQNSLGFAGLSASLGDLLSDGIHTANAMTSRNSTAIIESLSTYHCVGDILTPMNMDCRAGIVSFRPAGTDPASIVEILRNFGVQAGFRREAVRLSPSWDVDLAQMMNSVDKAFKTL